MMTVCGNVLTIALSAKVSESPPTRKAAPKDGLSIVMTAARSGHEAPLTRGKTPHEQESRSRIPTTAAEDNETLDHLLSIVDDHLSMNLIRVFTKACSA